MVAREGDPPDPSDSPETLTRDGDPPQAPETLAPDGDPPQAPEALTRDGGFRDPPETLARTDTASPAGSQGAERPDPPGDSPGPGAKTPLRAVWARWLAGRSLRARLIAGLLVLFTLSAVGVGVATAVALRPFLTDRLDQQLTAASAAFSAVNGADNGADNGPGNGPGNGQQGGGGQGDGDGDGGNSTSHGTPNMGNEAVGTLGVCFRDKAVTQAGLVKTSDEGAYGTVTPALSGADIAALMNAPPDGGAYSVHLSALGAYRVVATPRRHHAVNVTGLPLSDVDGTIRALELIEVIVFGAALLFIGVAGTAWIRLSLRPLGRITATAAEVTQMPLASGEVTLPHRVPGADPRTEVGQLGEAFDRMLGHVEQALGKRQASEARLRQFIADASHELRTPLAGIRGYTELALRGEDALDPELRRALSRVDAESARMSRLVDDLLLLARLDAGRPLAHEQVDLTRLAIDVTNDARVAGPRHRWVLDLPVEPVTVTGDQHRLHQVLANLLTNARAHTPPGTTVTVRLMPASAGEEDGGAELTVSDDGPGIPAELQAGVWARFARGDSARSRKAGGTGLGLAIVAAVVSAHQGRVSVASRAGKTTFRIWLPAAGPGQARAPG